MLSRYVLDRILSGEQTETVLEQIHEYLTTVGENVRGGQIKLDDFTIHKVRPDACLRFQMLMSILSVWVKTQKRTRNLRVSRTYKLH